MKKIFKSLAFLVILAVSILGIPILSNAVYADGVCSSSAPDEVKRAAGCSENEDQLPAIIQGILNAIIGVTGLVAVIYIIIGGVQYMTSSGDASKTEKAKKTILYALIGLIVCVLAFAIVNWVILVALKQTK